MSTGFPVARFQMAQAVTMRLLCVALAALICWSGPARPEGAVDRMGSMRPVPTVTLAHAERAEVQARVAISGSLVARREVQVFSQVAGYEVTDILVEAGDNVREGQLLARLRTDTLTAQLAQAEADFARVGATVSQAGNSIASAEATLLKAEQDLERARSLRERGSATEAALDQAIATEAAARAQSLLAANGLALSRAALAQSEAARKIAQLNLERAEIRAPVAGLVAARNVELGALSGAAPEPMFTLIADGKIELAAEVIETALQGLSAGAPAEIEVAGLGQIAGVVRLVPARVDPLTRLGMMRIALVPDPRLRAGLFASGWVITARREALTVPAGAVLADERGERVQLVREDGIVQSRPVRAGVLWQERREILEGLAAGDAVIARSGAFFRDGDRVRAANPVAANPAALDPAASPVAAVSGAP